MPDTDTSTAPEVSIAVAPLTCPFTVVCDTREQDVYTFEGMTDRHRPIAVPTMRATLTTGDYSIFGMPQIAIERKSKADLFGSVVRRENFKKRLERMGELSYSAVVVEAEISELLSNPPHFSKLKPKSLIRTIMAWSIRYPTRWWFLPNRDAGQGITYRLLERFWLDNRVDNRPTPTD